MNAKVNHLNRKKMFLTNIELNDIDILSIAIIFGGNKLVR